MSSTPGLPTQEDKYLSIRAGLSGGPPVELGSILPPDEVLRWVGTRLICLHCVSTAAGFAAWANDCRTAADWAREQLRGKEAVFIEWVTALTGFRPETVRRSWRRATRWLAHVRDGAASFTSINPYEHAPAGWLNNELAAVSRLCERLEGIADELANYADQAQLRADRAGRAPVPASGLSGAADLSVNERMLLEVRANPDAIWWSAGRWARKLGCSRGTVCGSKSWEAVMHMRQDAREGRRRAAAERASARA